MTGAQTGTSRWVWALALVGACGDETPALQVDSSAGARAQELARIQCDRTARCTPQGFMTAFDGEQALCIGQNALLLDAVLTCPALTPDLRDRFFACFDALRTADCTGLPEPCPSASADLESIGCGSGCSASTSSFDGGCETETSCTFGLAFTGSCSSNGAGFECNCARQGEAPFEVSVTDDVCGGASALRIQAACGFF